ncbi:MAG TPA: aldehyde dehydrogenase family protein [Phnomibacter sp.]|nr:aldehyde dehydrogenase family protein [Phnomibacter sp.]
MNLQPTIQHEPSSLSHTPQQLADLYQAQQQFFAAGYTRSFTFRKNQLRVLYRAIQRHESKLMQALHEDLRKSEFESFGTEIGIVLKEISHIQQNLRGWMAHKRQSTPLMFFPSGSKIVPEPRGISLIIGPWNYPFQLIISAMANSIAAGNTIILKPSELAPATTAALSAMVEETWEEEYIAVVNGPGHLVSSQLIEPYHLDIIHFTGSTAVGKLIMQSAAKQLSPVILELGGKSPCIVAADASIEYAAKKIAFTKLMNAGQVCVSADYLLVHESIKEKLVKAIIKNIEAMHGADARQSPYYGRIINEKHLLRLQSFLADGKIVYGGEVDIADRYFSPTLMEDVAIDAPIMQQEIFGPILPIITYQTDAEALAIIERHPYPLALYVYTNNKATENFFISKVRFGGGCVNNGLIHLGNANLPLGGVGYSGMGSYHGRYGFEAFSHFKSIMRSSTLIDFPLWYAPYKKWYTTVLRKLMK